MRGNNRAYQTSTWKMWSTSRHSSFCPSTFARPTRCRSSQYSSCPSLVRAGCQISSPVSWSVDRENQRGL